MIGFPQKITVAALLGAILFFGTSFLIADPVSQASGSACHDETPASPSAPNHDCCLVGHNHVLPTQAPTVPVLQISGVITASATVLTVADHQGPEPSIIESGSPPDTVPLRV
jgi:hypothetical protein